MFASEIRELTLEEIEQKLEDTHQELFNLRYQQAIGQLKDYNQLRIVRRKLARLKTVAREKTLM